MEKSRDEKMIKHKVVIVWVRGEGDLNKSSEDGEDCGAGVVRVRSG